MLDRRQMLAGLSTSTLIAAPLPVVANTAASAEILDLSNRLRQQQGLRALAQDAKLDSAAIEYAAILARNGKLSHKADGRSLRQRLSPLGYSRGYIAENIAYRSNRGTDAEIGRAIFEGWLGSNGHRKNILHPKLSRIGIGLAKTSQHVYAVQVFWGR